MFSKFVLSAALVVSTAWGTLHAKRGPVFSTAVGTQTVGVRYQFTDDSGLVETAKGIHELGADTLKIAITAKYDDDYRFEKNPKIKSMLDLVTTIPDYEQVMNMPFRNIMMWIYPFSDKLSGFFKGKIEKDEEESIYREIYEFTEHILKTHSGSGKSFFFGNWEGDWHMNLHKYQYDLDPTPEIIAGAIQWFNLRQRAIQDAIDNTPHYNVDVYYYIELNHVGKSMLKGSPTIVNKVLPHIKTDFVSWSSYDVSTEAAKMGNAEGKKLVMDALDYIEKHLPPSDIQGKRVIMGEYGFHLGQVKDAAAQEAGCEHIMKWCLEWGCPFILFWELYCNEIDKESGEHRGFWLVDKDGEKQPAWYLHRNFLKKANAFVDDYVEEHGVLPSQEFYNQRAVTWFENLESN